MQRSLTSLARPLVIARGFCTSPEKIVASVLFERLPVVIPKIDPVVYAFQEFSFRSRQQYRRRYPDELLDKSNSRGKGDYQMEYVPAPRITEADKKNDKKSLQRALDRRLYLLLYGKAYGAPGGEPVWHFPEKVYGSEKTLRNEMLQWVILYSQQIPSQTFHLLSDSSSSPRLLQPTSLILGSVRILFG
ncbi:39S ribosomal protein L46, mitochondrial-like isoform X2 [Juglans microcarpa x Juglans regia]|uniref:39S ribosomal protein L46, mitochondrial-like isoform X2 n=1 Tax=Juglans microcarpa x Juglans regia TaxID=2249226 RepID=UPI001B7E122D|nr:39S ribosomal protein L46, mitochondrial-like isoform X2 [Juglans microcarpa x Juglans regia]